jgi:glutamate racemase
VRSPRIHIGVFDSGFGGLTVLRAITQVLPEAKYLYFGDTARLPYGSKSAATVAKYACQATRFLEHAGAELIVVACNTATALAMDEIRRAVDSPVLGVVEPGAERASRVSRAQKVVVIGTEATISSHAYQRALARLGMEAREKACPLLVPLVEEGWVDHPVTEQIARIYLEEAFRDGFSSADVLLLGCTHYPLLKSIFHRVTPAGVVLVDSAESTAAAVSNLVGFGSDRAAPENASRERGNPSGLSAVSVRYFVTDSAEKFTRLGSFFIGAPIHEVTHIDLPE